MSRGKDEINQDYSNVCSQLGDLTARFEANKMVLVQHIAKLSVEMTEFENQEADQNKVSGPVLVPEVTEESI